MVITHMGMNIIDQFNKFPDIHDIYQNTTVIEKKLIRKAMKRNMEKF